ncbi:membrane protein insertion efficiency factor YidD [Varibaculum vaginae]|uniref:membrane protein insertion efficiency factor YidD n=1 Tax=Varibaculum vaginae TaxID=2364797 RepID=UPI001F43217C|nr:membrane protein insertion efficiency factor YidD [Varibaculum vaginae]
MRGNIAQVALISLIGFYRRRISPLFPPRCKYYPSCSSYALSALQIHGAFKGGLLATWRILRCNPLSDGGVDYPPEAGKWKSAPYHQMTLRELEEHWAKIDDLDLLNRVKQ